MLPIVDVSNPLLDSNPTYVYLRIKDEDGFEIRSFYIGLVAKDFVGALKGNLNIYAHEYGRIAGAEIYISSVVNKK